MALPHFSSNCLTKSSETWPAKLTHSTPNKISLNCRSCQKIQKPLSSLLAKIKSIIYQVASKVMSCNFCENLRPSWDPRDVLQWRLVWIFVNRLEVESTWTPCHLVIQITERKLYSTSIHLNYKQIERSFLTFICIPIKYIQIIIPKKSTHSNPSPDAARLRRDASHVDGACLYLRRRSCGSRRSRWSCSLNGPSNKLGTWEKLHPFPGSRKEVDQKLERVGWLVGWLVDLQNKNPWTSTWTSAELLVELLEWIPPQGRQRQLPQGPGVACVNHGQ